MRRFLFVLGALFLFVSGFGLGLAARFAPQATAQGNCQTFRETGKTVCGRFLEYWAQNGGVAQQGFPLTGEFTEVSDLDGKPYTVQYFERAVFEKHPENQRPYDVLLSQLGTFQLKRKYPGGDPTGRPPAPPTVPPVPPAPTPRPTPLPPISLRGSGEADTPPFFLAAGAYRVSWTIRIVDRSAGSANISLRSVDGTYFEPLFDEPIKAGGNPVNGTLILDNVPSGQYFVRIGGTGPLQWLITLEQQP